VFLKNRIGPVKWPDSISLEKSMTIHISPWILRRKWILLAVGLPVVVALWWAFRPEKLWVNQTVNEPAPFDTTGDPHPILTGRFEAKTQPTAGRATVYKEPDGEEYLRLNDFTTSSGPDVHIALARSDDRNLSQAAANGALDGIDLGPLKSNQGDQNYNLPSATDLNKYDAALVYSQQSHTVLGLAKLEPF
jgi:Electron transfer DM13